MMLMMMMTIATSRSRARALARSDCTAPAATDRGKVLGACATSLPDVAPPRPSALRAAGSAAPFRAGCHRAVEDPRAAVRLDRHAAALDGEARARPVPAARYGLLRDGGLPSPGCELSQRSLSDCRQRAGVDVVYVVNMLELHGDTQTLHEQPVAPGLDSLQTTSHEFVSPCGNRVILQKVRSVRPAHGGITAWLS
eukprot:scaffold1604_cov315-Prasinococcus_capsulatus_cf.AAC.5